MCGFAAALGTTDIQPAMQRLYHRGIRSKIVQDAVGTIGHVRLPIVGVGPNNDQPVKQGRWLIAFVGELLDFRQEYPGMDCDVEAVVHKWTSNGPHGFLSSDGFWAVVALDRLQEELHLLCDYLAQKPIYYREDLRAAASEPDAAAAFGPTTIDEIYMAAVVKWGYCPETGRTPYNEVKKVLPGQHVVLSWNKPAQKQVTDPLRPIAASPQVLRDQIELAVGRRVLSSDVPVACLLSGGLDSSIVYSLARRYGPVKPYYVSCEDVLSERLRVSLVAGKAEVEDVKWNAFSWRDATRIMQEPIDLGSLVPQVALSRAVGERVCLTGDGADEFFGGYGRAQRYDSQASDVWHELVAWHLPRLDRVMMRRKIEVRSPFLSRQVAGIALGMDRSMRIGKTVLRDIFRAELPPGIADQEKVPLRTKEVGEARTIEMVAAFREDHSANGLERASA